MIFADQNRQVSIAQLLDKWFKIIEHASVD